MPRRPQRSSDLTALDGWRQTLARLSASGAPDLTNRQLALLLTVFLDEGPHTVRALAMSLGLPKPAVTRALDRLSELRFLKRKADSADRRSVVIHRRVRGAVFLTDLADSIRRPGRR